MQEPNATPSEATVFVAKQGTEQREEVCTAAVSLGLIAHPVQSLTAVNDQHDGTHPACLVADLPIVQKKDPQLIAALKESEVDTPAELFQPHSGGHTLIASASILHDVERAIAGGSITFLRHPYTRDDLLAAIRLAIQSDESYQKRQSECQWVFDAIAKLSVREQKVLGMIYDGIPNKTIAKRLEVSERTVETDRSTVFKTFGVRTAVELARKLGEAGYRHPQEKLPSEE